MRGSHGHSQVLGLEFMFLNTHEQLTSLVASIGLPIVMQLFICLNAGANSSRVF